VRPKVFIHTNHRQMIGALVSAYSLRRNSAHADKFDIEVIDTRDVPFLAAKEGQNYLRGGLERQWLMEDLQSFTPLRFMPPELMGYEGRAVVIDPDIFAVGDVWELLSRDMAGKAILCRARKGAKQLASSVMLLDCAKLGRWRCEEQFGELFAFERDYMDWIGLQLEPREEIGLFEPEWNDFDRLTPKTKLLHNTKRWTQPWKTGLPIDFTPSLKTHRFAPLGWMRRGREAIYGRYGGLGRYGKHPDQNQERFFFAMLRECLEDGAVTEQMLRQEMAKDHVRHDAFQVLECTPRLEA
jgi:hypothetical protein